MHLLVTDIAWDDEGMGYEECCLPTTVVVLDAPDIPEGIQPQEIEDEVSELLSDAFGFCHMGFVWQRLSEIHDTHAGGGFLPERLGLVRFPQDWETPDDSK